MVKKLSLASLLFVGGSLLASCSQTPPETPPPPPAPGAPPGVPAPGAPPAPNAPGAPAEGASLKDPKSSISYQLDLVKAGDTEKLKTCFTPRLRDEITAEAVEKAKGEAGKYTLDDLYASAEMGEDDGKKTAKVKMKDGKTLTTLVETDGQWLADTIWFK